MSARHVQAESGIRSSQLARPSGRLGDTTARDYARKLSLFNLFAGPELRQLIAGLALQPGMSVLDAGCGTGEALGWFKDQLGSTGRIVGIDLAAAHTRAARAQAPADAVIAQADLQRLPLMPANFDLIWSVNTLHHLQDPRSVVECLSHQLHPGGRVAAGQSSFLADMIFAWDARLERLVNEAVREYYRDRYKLDEHDLTSVRALVGVLRGAKLKNVRSRTVVIERVSPLCAQDETFLAEAIFRDTWGVRLRPYMSESDYEELTRLCDPQSPHFALKRPDFHFLQSFTLVVGEV